MDDTKSAKEIKISLPILQLTKRQRINLPTCKIFLILKQIETIYSNLLMAASEPVLCAAAAVSCLALGILTPPALGVNIGLSVVAITRQIYFAYQLKNAHAPA